MNGYVIDYKNENEYRKLERALKKYNMLAYRKLNFEYYPSLRNGEFLGELVSQDKKRHTKSYELKLPSDKTFAQINGDVTLHYTVDEKKEIVILDTISPEAILIEGHNSELAAYKGVMITKEKNNVNSFKIDLYDMIYGRNK